MDNIYKSMRQSTLFNLSEISNENEMDYCLKFCVENLLKHKIIAIPTDTIYGIGCIPSSEVAIKKIYEIKGRDSVKPVAICVSDLDTIYKWSQCHLTKDELALFLPGKCTLIFRRSPSLYSHLNPGIESIGFRIPGEEFIVNLCSKLPEKSLVLTSANISNSMSSIIPKEFEALNNHIDVIVDKGKPLSENSCRLGSTVIDLSMPQQFRIVREGSNCSRYKEILTQILKYKHIQLDTSQN